MARQQSALTHARVLEMFEYDAATGNLLWKNSTTNRIRVGEVAGTVASNGRRYVGVDGETQMVHRLVWFWHKGVWPQFNLAPVDGDYLNTRIENLVEQTPRETAKKGGLRSNNKTGIKGVTWDAEKREYAVYGYLNGKSIFHSRHKTLEAAAEAAKEAEKGIIPDTTMRRQRHAAKIAQKQLWAKMIKWSRGFHRWESVEQFIADIGEQPHAMARLIPADRNKSMGPGNFAWAESHQRSKDAEFQQKKRYENREWYRDGHLMRKYHIRHADYVAKLIEQKGVCAICSQPETATDGRSGRIKEYHVDHDHETGKVRGLLCTACNTAIGHMQEDVERLKAAIRYIEKWKPSAVDPTNVVQFNAPLGFGA